MEQFFLDVMEWEKKTALDHIIGTRQGGVGGQKFFSPSCANHISMILQHKFSSCP